ncbi:Jip4 protein [Saccharomycopsis crataegensis]|uniref:Jip4 protein n=1 Tax=Saccharomycopsis crataegensis TaxID=43959 RepID=A0AAV5QGR4_9ASCO|nr:Jip4 protein [Saccharomycopsis crataegensis]
MQSSNTANIVLNIDGDGSAQTNPEPRPAFISENNRTKSASPSLIDQLLASSKQKKKKKKGPPPLYRTIGVRSAFSSPDGSTWSIDHIKQARPPYQSRVSFDTVNIDVSPSEGVDPEIYPEYYGIDPSLRLQGTRRVSETHAELRPEILASMSDSDYRKYQKKIKKANEAIQAMHNQVCCYSKEHKDFNQIYVNYNNRDTKALRPTDKLPAFPRRTILVYISGRKHTWVALDWAIKKLLKDGDHLVVVASIFPELMEKLDISSSAIHSRSVSRSPNRTNRFDTSGNIGIRGSRSNLGSRSGSTMGSRSASTIRTNRFKSLNMDRARIDGDDDDDDDDGDDDDELHGFKVSAGFADKDILDIRKKAKSIIQYIMTVADPDLIIKVTIDLSVGSTKDVLKDSYILYTPTLVVCSAKPKEDSAPLRSWKSSRLSDRVVKNFTIPVIIVPAMNMNKFVSKLFESLSERISPEIKTASSTSVVSATQIKAELPQNNSAPASLNDLVKKSDDDDDYPVSTNGSIRQIMGDISSIESRQSVDSDSSDSESDAESSDEEDTSDSESKNSISNDATSSKDAIEKPKRTPSKKNYKPRPKLLRIKTLISEMNYDEAPDLSTTQSIEGFVKTQEKKLDENLKLIPMILDESTDDLNMIPKFDPNYFKNQLDLVSGSSLYITKKLKSKDFTEDSEVSELVRRITGDVSLSQPKKFKSMLLDVPPPSKPKGRVPASTYNARSSGGPSTLKKPSAIKFSEPAKYGSGLAKTTSRHTIHSMPSISVKTSSDNAKSLVPTKSNPQDSILRPSHSKSFSPISSNDSFSGDPLSAGSSRSRSRSLNPEKTETSKGSIFKFGKKSKSKSKSASLGGLVELHNMIGDKETPHSNNSKDAHKSRKRSFLGKWK